MRKGSFFAWFVAVCAMALVTNLGACGSSSSNSDFGNGDGDGGPGSGDGSIGDGGGPKPCFTAHCDGGPGTGDSAPQCVGLGCQVNHQCGGGGKTTISGKVYDPAGKNPLYNVVVYVPTDPTGKLPPIKPGTNSCNTCDTAIDNIVVATLTDETGSFTLKDVPTGSQIPLVMQIGKWRREVFLPQVKDCVDNPAPAAATRLPRNQQEGDMPQMAVLTGGCDTLACLFRRIGIDDKEFTSPSGTGRMHVYKGVGGGDVQGGGAGNCTNASCPLWTSKGALERYDIAILSCECDEHNETKGGTNQAAAAPYQSPQMQAMHDWLNEGGKTFATHYHYTWFKNNGYAPEFAATASWTAGNSGGADTTAPYRIDTTFPKGQSFVKWMNNLNALSAQPDQVQLDQVKDDVNSLNQGKGALRWIYSSGDSPKYMSFNTPIGGVPSPDGGAASYCGKAVFSDIHVSSDNASTVPTSCNNGDLTPQEKALEFLFFDLSACVQNDQQPPQPPTPR